MTITYHETTDIHVDNAYGIRAREDVWGTPLLKIGDEWMYPVAVDYERHVVTVIRNAQDWWK